MATIREILQKQISTIFWAGRKETLAHDRKLFSAGHYCEKWRKIIFFTVFMPILFETTTYKQLSAFDSSYN